MEQRASEPLAPGLVVTTTAGLAGVIAGFAALVGYKYYENSQQTALTKSFTAAMEHCQSAHEILVQLEKRISKANTGVQVGKDTLSDVATSTKKYAALDKEQFNEFMADQLDISIKQMKEVLDALAPASRWWPNKSAPVAQLGVAATTGVVIGASGAALYAVTAGAAQVTGLDRQ